MKKIILVDRLPVINKGDDVYSIECNFADALRHFDHHGRWANNPAPCRDRRIPKAGEDSTIYISHIDADTFAGVQRLYGMKPPRVDLEALESADNHGASICRDDDVRMYIIGVSELSRSLGFPRVRNWAQDVTKVVEKMMEATDTDIISLGRQMAARSEITHRECLRMYLGEKLRGGRFVKKGLWLIDKDDPINPARPYADGYDVVMIFRKHYRTISIYCNPRSNYAFAGSTIGGIKFSGHPQTCGSPRGMDLTEEDAIKVFNALDMEDE
jgi:hypothetical protein